MVMVAVVAMMWIVDDRCVCFLVLHFMLILRFVISMIAKDSIILHGNRYFKFALLNRTGLLNFSNNSVKTKQTFLVI